MFLVVCRNQILERSQSLLVLPLILLVSQSAHARILHAVGSGTVALSQDSGCSWKNQQETSEFVVLVGTERVTQTKREVPNPEVQREWTSESSVREGKSVEKRRVNTGSLDKTDRRS